jgi:signal transduction histidine kinase
MLKELRRKILFMNIFFVGVALAAGFTVFFIISFNQAKKDLYSALGDVLGSEGTMQSYSQLFGFVNTNSNIHIVLYNKTNADMKIIAGRGDNSVRETSLIAAAKALLDEEAHIGRLKRYKLFYCKEEAAEMIKMAFVSEDVFIKMYTDSAKEAFYTDIIIIMLSLSFVMLTSIVFYKRNLEIIDNINSEQRRFMADASHKLKTPLAIILANNGMVRSHPEEPVYAQLGWLDSTEREIADMKKLIDGMLLLAKAEASLPSGRTEDVNLSNTVTRCVLQFEALAYEAGISLNSDIDEDIYILGQEQRVRGIIQSLIENAVKYEEKGGNIDISLKKYGKRAIFRIRNTTLISEDDLPHIFDKFYRGASERKESGHGLGLSIVKAAVESMGGTIKAVSSERSGTVFTVIFHEE